MAKTPPRGLSHLGPILLATKPTKPALTSQNAEWGTTTYLNGVQLLTA